MKSLIALLLLALLVAPMLAGIRRIRQLPRKQEEEDSSSPGFPGDD